jgi:hypothetical protein
MLFLKNSMDVTNNQHTFLQSNNVLYEAKYQLIIGTKKIWNSSKTLYTNMAPVDMK